MSKKPLLVVFAGPNGSGKSTVTNILYEYDKTLPELYINADSYKRKYNCSDLEAAQKSDEMRKTALEQKQSFVTETVMSTPGKINLMKEAKSKGYEVQLIFVMTQQVNINIERVKERYKKGEHDVPIEKIEKRYPLSLQLMPIAIQTADMAMVYNNSFIDPRLILRKINKEIEIFPQNPPNLDSKWTKAALENLKATIEDLENRNPPKNYYQYLKTFSKNISDTTMAQNLLLQKYPPKEIIKFIANYSPNSDDDSDKALSYAKTIMTKLTQPQKSPTPVLTR